MKFLPLSLILLASISALQAMEPAPEKPVRDPNSLKSICARYLNQHPDISTQTIPQELQDYIEVEKYISGPFKEFCTKEKALDGLHYMCAHNIASEPLLRYLQSLSNYIRVNAYFLPWAHKKTPAMVAAEYGCNDVLKLLIRKGADINAEQGPSFDEDIRNALGYAITNNHRSTVNILLREKASLKRPQYSSFSPFFLALDNKSSTPIFIDLVHHLALNPHNQKIIEYLQDTLFEVIKYGHFSAIQPLAHYCDINNQQPCTQFWNKSFLHWACSALKKLDRMAFLISAGANINVKDRDGFTPLYYCLSAGYFPHFPQDDTLETVQFLLSQGADKTIRNKQGRTVRDYVTAMIDPTREKFLALLDSPQKPEIPEAARQIMLGFWKSDTKNVLSRLQNREIGKR